MIEKIGNKDVLVQDYTSNFKVKEFIQEVLIPKAFPGIPMNKLNIGFTGVVSEYIGQAIEDSYSTAALMMNESFVNKAILPRSIYAEASLYNLGYSFAVPSRCEFAVQISLKDIIQYSTKVTNNNVMRYVIDKDTKIMLGDNDYRFDYDIIIDHIVQDGRRIFKIYYDTSEENSIANLSTKYIRHQVTSIDWLILFIELKEFDRKTDEVSITDNLTTRNSDIELDWYGQIAGFDLVYISPSGERMPMKKMLEHTPAAVEPFVWYRFEDDDRIILSFPIGEGYWTPEFNSSIEYTIYTCKGSEANFDVYNNKTGIPVEKTGERFPYNSNTKMVALCYGGSIGGLDRGDIENLRDDIIYAKNTCDVLTTSTDIQLWFEKYGKRYGSRSNIFKRRDDPSGKLFSQFIAITKDNYVFPTNTLSISVDQNQFDYVNSDANGINKEFIIKAGHLWEYDNTKPNMVKMVSSGNSMAMINDDALPLINDTRKFLFVNPFSIKINRDPTISMSYNYLINDTSWPENITMSNDYFYQFQLATFSIKRNLSQKKNGIYHIEVICVPNVTSDDTVTYIEGIGDEYPKINNNLRLVLITKTRADGETGYIEMDPIEIREGKSILFSTDLVVLDNISSDSTIEIDPMKTQGMRSLITDGPKLGKVFIDSEESIFHIAVMMKDTSGKFITRGLYNDDSFKEYTMANRFCNNYRSLNLYKPMDMMRSVIKFSGENNNYNIEMSLIPFLKWNIALDDEKMAYFSRAFVEQYRAMEPVISKLEGNSFLDFKLYNTYGKSNNYFIGPKDGSLILKDSDIKLDDVHVRVKLRMAVYDRSLYTQTVNDVINELISFFNMLNNGDKTDVHLSNILRSIEVNHPNVKYIRFLGFNDYDANKQSIFIKDTNMDKMDQSKLIGYVPEIIRVDANSIHISEET